MDDVFALEVGKMGPAGSGVSAAAWNELVGRVNSLLIPTGNPLVDGSARYAPFTISTATPNQITDVSIVFTPDPTKAVILQAWTSADITSSSGSVAKLGVTVGGGTFTGPYFETPSGAGTYAAIAAFGQAFPPGVLSTFSVRPIVYSTPAAPTTYANLRVWASVIQPG